ncbi:MAG: hypothetical protein ABI830_05270 [Pseudolabrys sp.]
MRRVFGVVAIVVIALNAVLAGLSPVIAAPSIDPFTVICHSGADAAGGETPADTPAPANPCHHCTLCSAAPAPSASLDTVLARQLLPAKLLHVLRPAPVAPRDGIASNPHQARGPPHVV